MSPEPRHRAAWRTAVVVARRADNGLGPMWESKDGALGAGSRAAMMEENLGAGCRWRTTVIERGRVARRTAVEAGGMAGEDTVKIPQC